MNVYSLTSSLSSSEVSSSGVSSKELSCKRQHYTFLGLINKSKLTTSTFQVGTNNYYKKHAAGTVANCFTVEMLQRVQDVKYSLFTEGAGMV